LTFQKPSRELSIGEILSWTFGMYTSNFVTFFIPILVSSLITGFLSSAVTFYATSIPQPSPVATPTQIWTWLFTYIPILLLAAFALGILSWIIGTIAYGIVVKCASDLTEKGSANLINAFNHATSKLLSLLAVAIVSGILIILGLIALIIPGIILAIMFSLVIPAIIIENAGAIDSLSRSRKLVSHRWLKTFAFLLIIGIIIGVASVIVTWTVSPLSIFGGAAGSIVSSVLSAILTAFIVPIYPIALTVYYYSMLAKEQPSLPPPPPPIL